MGKWKTVRLGDVCEINPPLPIKVSNGTYCSVVPMDAVSIDGKLLASKVERRENISNGLTAFYEGDILFAKITPCMENGKATIAKGLTNKIGFGSTEFHVLRPASSVNTEWLFHIVHSEFFRKKAQQHMTGSAGQKRVPALYLKKFEIPLPLLDVQKKIADVLDKASALIELRRSQLDKLDLLVKSQFIEMFGDPVVNPRSLRIVKLGDLCSLITKGASPSWQGYSYTNDESQTRFVTSENVREGWLDFSCKKYLEDAFNYKQQRSSLRKGDFLINIVGASIGRAARFEYDLKANINQAVALVRLNSAEINHAYLLYYLNSPKALLMYNMMKSDVARANLSLQDINNLDILLPSIEEQNQFAAFVQQVDKSKFAIQQSLSKLELNYKSLMQKCFRGDLF